MNLVIKPLTADLTNDYLDFFDNRAFTDRNPNGPCYCTAPYQDDESIKRMVREFDENGVKQTLRKYAVRMLCAGKIHGYLAFDGNVAIGWCNAADMSKYKGFVPAFARKNALPKTVSVVCFEVAPAYRRKGVALALLNRVCEDAKCKGYQAVEGYTLSGPEYPFFDYRGPRALFEKAGFCEISQENDQVIYRKMLT